MVVAEVGVMDKIEEADTADTMVDTATIREVRDRGAAAAWALLVA